MADRLLAMEKKKSARVGIYFVNIISTVLSVTTNMPAYPKVLLAVLEAV
jgi:hypothetical protein